MDFSNFWWQAAAAAPPQPGGDPGDAIGQSLRFGAGRDLTGTGAALQNDWTASWWFKYAVEGAVSSERIMCGAGGSYFSIFEVSVPSHQFFWSPTFPGAVFGPAIRDPSAWYHVVLQSTATKSTVWLNGEQIGTSGSAGSTNFFQTIGRNTNNTNFEGLMAGWHVIDGQALDPTTFGRFNASGVWVPVNPQKDGDTAWYGTNGFHLKFAPGNVGKDYSGNGNDFTATGFETANQTSPLYDIMQDSPTNNFATLNPLPKNSSGTGTYSDANLTGVDTNATQLNTFSATQTLDRDSSYYWEAYIVNKGGVSGQPYFGVINPLATNNNNADGVAGAFYYTNGLIVWPGSSYYNFSTGPQTSPLPSDFTTGDTLSFYWDGSNNTLAYRVNGANEWKVALSNTQNIDVAPFFGLAHSQKISINYGQQPFRYTPPAGFEPLSTANMPTDELPDTITGTFTGNNNANGPFVYTGCIPARIQYGTIDVKYQDRFGQTNVDFLSNGFKVRSTTSNSGTVNYTVTTTHDGGEYDGNKVPFQSPAPAVSN